jgi:hypothetical protein
MDWLAFLFFLAVAGAAVAGILWGRKYFRHEIDRAKRIRRASKNK